MKRIVEIGKTFKAKDLKSAAKKFYDFLIKKGYEWVAEEMIESVKNGYICCTNASRCNLQKGKISYNISNDWSYYWGLENVDDTNEYYAWFIERA